MKKLKIKNFKKVITEKTIDTFTETTSDNQTIYLHIKESGNCILQSRFQIIGWTDDKHFAFNVLRNVVPVVTFNELFDNRGVIPK